MPICSTPNASLELLVVKSTLKRVHAIPQDFVDTYLHIFDGGSKNDYKYIKDISKPNVMLINSTDGPEFRYLGR